jgi:hydrogenase maturation protein HypF
MKERIHITIRGAVQGVGFRPFVFRLATSMGLTGSVLNSPQGVFIDAEGERRVLEEFLLRLPQEKPPRSFIQSFEYSFLDTVGFPAFEILHSTSTGERTTLVLPDIATCPECLSEIFHPGNRRYLYPFTNCTNCGPRFSIITSLPYDRPNTSMSDFVMCDRCRSEYENPLDRRFHAQPNACPDCGPVLELWDPDGQRIGSRAEALTAAVALIREGSVVAIKGLGGFHLVVDAQSEDAVHVLRQRKHREEKPFAIMAPSLAWIQKVCSVSELEARLLSAPEAPIVLLQQRPNSQGVAEAVAPRNPYLGVMLPYTPLHHILLHEIGQPVVATSGNLADEPICTDEHDALKRLHGIADAFLVHNRAIVRHTDDSIARVMLGRELILRRARGYAPLPVELPRTMPDTVAVGAHLKNAIAVAKGRNVFISQHIGDLETQQSYEAFQYALVSFQSLFQVQPSTVVSDMHPDYLSTKYARTLGPPVVTVQHHYAHVASCMAENHLQGRVLGVSWDGTGYGLDGTVWGGEFLVAEDSSFRRAATFRRFMLPGGNRAVKEPRRSAVGLLYELFGTNVFDQEDSHTVAAFSNSERRVISRALEQRINAPLTSSAGRLFDAVASIVGLRQIAHFEGQAAMELEFATASVDNDETYPYRLTEDGVFDWTEMIHGILLDVRDKTAIPHMAAKFHNTLTGLIVDVARRIGIERVVLTGGCFQNRYLAERTIRRLTAEGFHPYWHQRVPPNDGGIALGQIYAAHIAAAGRTRETADE